MTDPIDAITVVGAAILGALIGSGLTLASEACARRERRRHAARAVQYEVVRNATLLVQMASTGRASGPILTDTWKQHAADVAGLLTKVEFADLSGTYVSADEAEERRRPLAGGATMFRGDREFFESVGRQFHDVVKILDRRAW